MTSWNILYRGSLSSCNYDCRYCPFAKTANTSAELQQDAWELSRFVDWVGRQTRRLGILFTPWGEALGHRSYRRALVELSRMPQVDRVALQTNLSAPVEELAEADRESLALWTTFHPTQTSMDAFLARCQSLDRLHLRYSVGVVGMREHFAAIEGLRLRLRPEIYLWVNAYKDEPEYYRPEEVERLSRVDPYLGWNLQRYPSKSRDCRAGETTFSVDGAGEARRCHFVPTRLGNIYEADFEQCLAPRPCPAATCGCYIGYVHRPGLRLESLYGRGLLERIPARWPLVELEFAAGPKSTGGALP